jgi:LPXTG-motif cell wall-anchored protein
MEVKSMKLWNRILFAALIFVLMAMPFSGFKQTAHAAGSTASVEVIGQDGKDLQAETSTSIDSTSTALSSLETVVGKSNVDAPNGMITTIDGVSSPSDWSAYWSFYINNVSAPIGAGSYHPVNGDKLLFQYHPSPGTLSDEVAVTIPDKAYGTSSLFVKVNSSDTVLSVLQKMQKLYNVVIKNNQLYSIGDFIQDSSNSWVISDVRQKAKQNVTDMTSFNVQGQDQLTFSLKQKTGSTTGSTGSNDTSQTTKPSITLNQINSAINQATTYVNKNGVSDWNAIALSKAGKSIPSSYLTGVASAVKAAGGQFHAITDAERYTLGILAAGGDPTTISGTNLVKSIYSGDVTKQGLNGVIFGLNALESANFPVPSKAKWTKAKLTAYLVQHQNADGGWAWDGSKTSDLDTTGMVLAALAKQSSDTNVKAAILKGETYLSNQFKAGKVDNSSTAAQLVIGLTANGIDPQGTALTKTDGTTLLSYLLSFQEKDGGFDWQGKDESAFSTDQGFLALVADQLFLKNQGSLYTFNWKQHPVDTKVTNVVASAKTKSGEPLPNTATPFYNYLILGLMLVLIGLFSSLYLKRKRA